MHIPRVTRPARLLGAVTLGLALTLTAAACRNDDAGSSAQVSTTGHNDADVRFATDMMQHHAQALVMADLTMTRPLDPDVVKLVDDIRAAQGPEIETFDNWLTDWDEEVPETMRDHVNAGHGAGDLAESLEGSDHGDMPGMMTAEDFTALEDASNAEFQTLWLRMMSEHHTGAVEMAETEQQDGQYQRAVDLAGEIITSQSAEIERMQDLLDS